METKFKKEKGFFQDSMRNHFSLCEGCQHLLTINENFLIFCFFLMHFYTTVCPDCTLVVNFSLYFLHGEDELFLNVFACNL